MRRELIVLGLAICMNVLANAQIYEVDKLCLIDDWIEIDTCEVESGTFNVYHIDNYKIHAYCKETDNNTTELKIIAVFKRTEWPTIGYSQVLETNAVDEIISDLRIDYGDNEARITQRTRLKEKRNKKQLAQKY